MKVSDYDRVQKRFNHDIRYKCHDCFLFYIPNMDNHKCCELFEMKILFKAFFKTLRAILTSLIEPVGRFLYIVGVVWLLFSCIGLLGTFILYMDNRLATHSLGSVLIANDCAFIGVMIIIGCVAFWYKMKPRIKEIRCQEEHRLYHVIGQICPCGRKK